MTSSSQAIRLATLIMYLLHPPAGQPHGWSIAQLRTAIGQYDGESGRRQFNRDREELAAMGLQVIETTGHEDGSITFLRLEQGSKVTFDAGEIALIRALARAQTHPDFERLAQRLSMVQTEADPHLAPTNVPLPGQLATVLQAIADLSVLTFEYQGLSDALPQQRKIEPHQVRVDEGIWYLVARDRKDGQEKLFRFDRITSQVHARGRNQFARRTQPAPAASGGAVVSPLVGASPGFVFTDVPAEAVVDAVADLPSDWRAWRLPPRPLNRWVRYLAGFGSQVKLIAPDELASELGEHLRRVVSEASHD